MGATALQLPNRQSSLDLFLNNLDSENSRRIYQFELNKFFDVIGKKERLVESLDILRFKASLSENKPSTKNRKLSIIKSYFGLL